MKFTHRFRVNAPRDAVAEFHSQASSLSAITPPLILLRLQESPPVLRAGDRMALTMWIGPLPVRWLVEIAESSPDGFVDRQIRGPFKHWEHRHSFFAADSASTDVVDEVEASLRAHWLWGPVGLSMWLGLPVLFAYRQWRTRRLLRSRGPR